MPRASRLTQLTDLSRNLPNVLQCRLLVRLRQLHLNPSNQLTVYHDPARTASSLVMVGLCKHSLKNTTNLMYSPQGGGPQSVIHSPESLFRLLRQCLQCLRRVAWSLMDTALTDLDRHYLLDLTRDRRWDVWQLCCNRKRQPRNWTVSLVARSDRNVQADPPPFFLGTSTWRASSGNSSTCSSSQLLLSTTFGDSCVYLSGARGILYSRLAR